MKTLSKLIPLTLLLVAAACTGDAIDDSTDGADLGKADGFGAPRMVVVRNQIACFTAPCPVFTVIDSTGSVFKVADVKLPDDQIDEYEGLSDAGLEVEGVVVVGEWTPGQPGDVLEVDRVVSRVGHSAPVYNGVACFTAPCPSYNVISDDGTHTAVAGIDLSALDLSAETAEQLQNDFTEGRLLVGGFVRQGSWNPGESGDVFVVTTFATLLDDYEVQSAHIACVTFPCPAWSAVSSTGDVQFFDDINLDGLELSDAEATEVFEKLHDSSITLRGFASPVVRDLFDGPTTLYTFHVTRVVPDEAAE